MRSIATALVSLALGSAAFAQVSTTLGPDPVPFAGTIGISMTNVGTTDTFIGDGCPYEVRRTSDGAVFYSLPCPLFAAIELEPGETASFFWDLRDDFNQLVPPDTYTVRVFQPDGVVPSFVVTVGGVDAALAFLGPAKLGETPGLLLTSPPNAGRVYLAMASLATTPGIPTCAGVVPMAPFGIFFDSINPASPTFLSFLGVLDPFIGRSLDPHVAVPSSPSILGVQVWFDYVALDFTQPCVVTAIAAPVSVVVVQ
jgi:hypothetical protein